MLDVIFIMCAIANPKDCQTLRIETKMDDNHFIQCVFKAEEQLAQYVTKDYFVQSFGCRRHDSKDG